jgi:glyoxylase-like metal-dependent hydrolase (beta-lactamase superfamily II)
MINIKKFTFNPIGVNAFVLWDETNECVIIDAACFFPQEEQKLKDFIESAHLKPVRLLNTHGHFDHLMGNGFAEKVWGLKTGIHQADNFLVENALSNALMFGIQMPKPPAAGSFLKEGDVVFFGNSEMKVIHVPGHSPGSVAFYSEKDQFMIVGDILFNGSIGRTDLPMGNHEQLISGIKSKLLVLDDDVLVYSGHGPETTIGNEKWSNPYLQ